ncbi:MAG: hypothetical protein LBU20_02555 [Candidatus Nomurabacteria bacterium]|jgi:exopolyphosphatase/pppGpp-phosphohydrolase|nr:hypothetical protein [Candidatus Nomurabacteria bacterium]
MQKIAVIDLGSLKLKTTVFDKTKHEKVGSISILTLLGKELDNNHRILSSSLEMLAGALVETKQYLQENTVDEIKIIGTEALRKAKNKSAAQKAIDKHFPRHEIEIIDQNQEAVLFFTAVSHDFPNETITAMDIGGGSVQIINGKFNTATDKVNIENSNHYKTGTYRLQQQYSPSNEVISDRLDEAAAFIKKEYSNIAHKSSVLVFGSTCMLDFIMASGITVLSDANNKKFVTRKSLENLLGVLVKLPPNKRNCYYPENEYFMYGADFLLMNIIAASKKIGASRIYPTNINSAYAYA